jgi:hypothetical protein
MFALWPMGRYGDILGQNHQILLKNRQILENCIIKSLQLVLDNITSFLILDIIDIHD